MMNLKIGDKAPDFDLPDATGKHHTLADFRGNKLLVYFYPKDDTAGCTKEACSLRDNLPNFNELKTQIIGISGDSIESHLKFSQKFDLNFLLLADPDRMVLKKYNVWQKKNMFGRILLGILRTSFLIDENGKILKIYERVKPDIHARQVLTDLKNLN